MIHSASTEGLMIHSASMNFLSEHLFNDGLEGKPNAHFSLSSFCISFVFPARIGDAQNSNWTAFLDETDYGDLGDTLF
jgi:hypothetical protein